MSDSQPSSHPSAPLVDSTGVDASGKADPDPRPSVLIVENEPVLRSVLVTSLREAGMLPLEASTLAFAAKALKQQDFQGVVMSLDWAWEETWTLLTKIRRKQAYSSVPTSCVFISVLSAAEVEQSFGRLPGAHCTKPIDPWQIVASLKQPR